MILQLQKSQPAPDICLVEFSGKLMMGNDSRQVEWTVSELLNAGTKKIVFELSKLDSIDSTGVGIIVMCDGKVRKAGGEVRIAGTSGFSPRNAGDDARGPVGAAVRYRRRGSTGSSGGLKTDRLLKRSYGISRIVKSSEQIQKPHHFQSLIIRTSIHARPRCRWRASL